jgi:hypothetical protein
MSAAIDGVASLAPDRTPGLRRSSSPIPPLIVWLILQAAAFALAAARVPLSAHYPQAGERLAIDLVLAVQIGGSAALFPMLMRTRRSAVVTVCSAWPFIAFAAVLSALPTGRVLAVAGFITAWLVVLAIWNAVLTIAKWRLVASAIAVLVTVGGALLGYLHVEFAAPGAASPPADGRYGPLLAALGLSDGQPQHVSTWLALAVAALLGVLANISRIPRGTRARVTPSDRELPNTED